MGATTNSAGLRFRTVAARPSLHAYIIEDSANSKHFLLRELTFSSELAIREASRRLKNRQALSHPHLLNLIQITESSQKTFCSEFHKLLLVYENVSHSLLQEMHNRHAKGLPFSQEQLFALAQNAIQVLSHFQASSLPHGKISAQTILLDERGKVKLLDPEYAALILSNSNGLLSPEQVGEQLEGLALISLSDIFKLGVVLLQASLLHPLPLQFYDYARGRVRNDLLAEQIKLLSPTYSPQWIRFLEMCLKQKNSERPGLADLSKFVDSSIESLELESDISVFSKSTTQKHGFSLKQYKPKPPTLSFKVPKEQKENSPSPTPKPTLLPLSDYKRKQAQRADFCQTVRLQPNHINFQQPSSSRQGNSTARPLSSNALANNGVSAKSSQVGLTFDSSLAATHRESVYRQPNLVVSQRMDAQSYKHLQQTRFPIQAAIEQSRPASRTYDLPLSTAGSRPLVGLRPLTPIFSPASITPKQPIQIFAQQELPFAYQPTHAFVNQRKQQQPVRQAVLYESTPRKQQVQVNRKQQATLVQSHAFAKLKKQQVVMVQPSYQSTHAFVNQRKQQTTVQVAGKPRIQIHVNGPAKPRQMKMENVFQASLVHGRSQHNPRMSVIEQAREEIFTTGKKTDVYASVQSCEQDLFCSVDSDRANSLPRIKLSFGLVQEHVFSRSSPDSKSKRMFPEQQVCSMNNDAEQVVPQNTFQQDPEYVIEELSEGGRYEGWKMDGMRHGEGMFYYRDGGYYCGEWEEDTMSGKGILYYATNKPAYDGHWADDLFHGQGTLFNEFPDSLDQAFDYHDFGKVENYWVKYEGRFERDSKVGKGRLFLTNGEVYEGLFEDDDLNGPGTFWTMDGSEVQGTWLSNVML